MKKPCIFFALFFLSALLFSCKKKIKSEKGAIDIISNVYFNASKDLNNIKHIYVSKLNYRNDTIIEIVPDLEFPEITSATFFIKDSLYYQIDENNSSIVFSEIQKKSKPLSVFNKTSGAVFTKEKIENYRNRKNLRDTLLFKKKYKRFEINSPWTYTRYYIYPTDTILPYSIYRTIEEDYGGRIERIDSYNKKQDIFVSVQLIPRKNLDETAEEIFRYNHFLNNRKKLNH